MGSGLTFQHFAKLLGSQGCWNVTPDPFFFARRTHSQVTGLPTHGSGNRGSEQQVDHQQRDHGIEQGERASRAQKVEYAVATGVHDQCVDLVCR